MSQRICITGASGYLGRALCRELAGRSELLALVRQGGAARVAKGVRAVELAVFASGHLAAPLAAGDTLVHLIGTSHPNPSKAAEFERVDLASVRACVKAAAGASVAHFLHVSEAAPAPVMHAYVAPRQEGERAIAAASLTATILRPW